MNGFFGRLSIVLVVGLMISTAAGCLRTGKRVHPSCVPSQQNALSRADKLKLNFLQLRQDPPKSYLLASGDVLGVFIEGVTGSDSTPPPVHFPEDEAQKPAVGYPIPVRDDGRISLPLVGPIYVAGATISETEEKVREEYIKRQILQPGRDRIIVTLMRRRRINVTVVREDTESINLGQTGSGLSVGSTKKGRTFSLDLPAYENDVLHALSETGGLPGEDAKNEIIILRGGFKDAQENPYLMQSTMNSNQRLAAVDDTNVTRIPIRVSPGEMMPPLSQQEIILRDGDVVLIEGRETEVFYTGGLLDGGQHPIPRDYDIDVLGAIAIAGGSLATSAGGQSGSVFGGGGNASNVLPASRVRLLRQTGGGDQYEIPIDLKRAVTDPAHRVIIQPGDVVILEYRPYEVFVNSAMGIVNYASFGLFNRF